MYEYLQIFDKSFCLTGDSLLKILAIVYRVKCKIPVVLLGECGCGKTMLISFLCKWLGVKLLTLDVHGGTEEKEIIAVFDKAQSILDFSHELHSSGNNNSNSSYGAGNTVFVFLDEVNTCAHMGLLVSKYSILYPIYYIIIISSVISISVIMIILLSLIL